MILGNWYNRWYYSDVKPTGYTCFGKIQWSCYAKCVDGVYHHGVGYPTLDPSGHHVIVFAKTLSKAEKQVHKIFRKSNKLYR